MLLQTFLQSLFLFLLSGKFLFVLNHDLLDLKQSKLLLVLRCETLVVLNFSLVLAAGAFNRKMVLWLIAAYSWLFTKSFFEHLCALLGLGCG